MQHFLTFLLKRLAVLPDKLGIQNPTSKKTFWWFVCVGWFFVMLMITASVMATSTTNLIGSTSVNVYSLIETLPNSLYPFQQEIEGQLVRGRDAYQNVVDSGIALYGENYTSLSIIIYRGAWHVLGSVVILLFLLHFGRRLFPTNVLLYSFVLALFIGLILQELVFHPSKYDQPIIKGVFDVLTWLAPVMIYKVYTYYKKGTSSQ
jgi:hypothetical protein